MAQAGDSDKTDLMTRLTNRTLGTPNADVPAKRDESTPSGEPVDPGTKGTVVEGRGKRPEEVLGDQAGRQPTKPAPKPADEDLPLAAQPADKKPAPKERTWKYKGEELTLKQIVDRNLLDSVFASAEQLPALTKRHQEVLEQVAATAAAKPAPVAQTPEAQAKADEEAIKAHQQMTLKVIDAYGPAAKQEIAFYVANGLIEQDMVDAYEKSVHSMFAIFLYHLDAIQANASRTESAIQWIRGEVDYRGAVRTQNALFAAMDAVVAKHKGKPTEQFYAGLKEPENRKQFVTWLRKEVDLPTDKITEDIIGSQWLAFNAGAIMEFAEGEREDENTRQPSQRHKGDGTSARIETPASDEPKSLLDRFTDRALGSES